MTDNTKEKIAQQLAEAHATKVVKGPTPWNQINETKRKSFLTGYKACQSELSRLKEENERLKGREKELWTAFGNFCDAINKQINP